MATLLHSTCTMKHKFALCWHCICLTSAKLQKIAFRAFGGYILNEALHFFSSQALPRFANVFFSFSSECTERTDNDCTIALPLAITLQLFAFSFSPLSLQVNPLLQQTESPSLCPLLLSLEIAPRMQAIAAFQFIR